MNFSQRMARRLGQAYGVLRDPDAGLLIPLPPPLVDPRVDAAGLGRAAREQGRSDGERYLFDGWSFGREEEPPEAVLDPEYVRGLRRQCDTAIHEHRDRQRLTDARLADLHLSVREAERGMRAARERMARVAVRDQLDEEDSLRAFLRRRNLNADTMELPPLGDPVWEGEVTPMHPVWRVLLVGFLFTVVFMIERHVAEIHLPAGQPGGQPGGVVLTAGIAALTIVGPLVAGQLLRNRHATGYDRVLAALTFVLLLPALSIVTGFGLLAARLSGAAPAAADGSAAAAALTPATLVVVFTVVLFLACAMAYIIGLAQRHPFQRAFASSRHRRDRTIQLAQRLGSRINPDYRADAGVAPLPDPGLNPGAAAPDGSATTGSAEVDPPPPPGPATPEAEIDRELAIRNAYLAAENAYFQGLIEAVADPTFTEAVLRRRNRPAAPPADTPLPGWGVTG